LTPEPEIGLVLCEEGGSQEEERQGEEEKDLEIGGLGDWGIGGLDDWAMFEGIIDGRWSMVDGRFFWDFITFSY